MKSNKVCAIVGNYLEYKDLEDLVKKRSLASLPFDGKYRLIDFQLSSLVNANIRQVFLALHDYQIPSLLDHIGSGKEWGLDTITNRYFMGFYELFREQKGKDYCEHLLDFLRKSRSEITVYTTSSAVTNIDLKPFIDLHRKNGRNISTLYKKIDSQHLSRERDILSVNEEKQIVEGVHHFDPEVDRDEKLNFGIGIYIINTDWLIDFIEKNVNNDMESFVLALALPKIIAQEKTGVYEYIGYLKPIHDVKSYYDANMDMLDSHKFNALLYSNNRIFTKVKNEVPTYFARGSKVKKSQFASGSVIEGTVKNSIISRNNIVDAGSVIEDSIIFPHGKIKSGAKIRYAILDKNVVIEKNVTVSGTKDKPLVIQKHSVIKESIISE
ncbi:MAG: glucose-1-phosphate adenylyltransferase subunit GlgD [Streptococcaceae bacterium]|jgi:glucose-1-phosphate adenylyltransferase|nr:glucose-1-phosphate adenylyltransferase subunit GlgD [Streptococcaceae bacterium]